MTESASRDPVAREPERLSDEAIRKGLASLAEWRLAPDRTRITRHFCFPSYQETIEFVLKAARVAHSQQHYPVMRIERFCLEIDCTTPEAGGVTEYDIALASHLDTCHFVHLASAGQARMVHYPGAGGGCSDGCGSSG